MNAIEVRGVRKHYGKKAALDGIDLVLEAGSVLGIVGPNGAGKTTLIKVLLGLTRADEGTASVFGLNAANDGRAVRERIGFVHESASLPDCLSVRGIEKVLRASYPGWSREIFAGYLERFELRGGQRIGTLSKGQKTRLCAAAALSHDAGLILLDEPTSGLDPVFRRELLEILGRESARGDRTIVVSTHITSDLDRISDRIVGLDSGRIRIDFLRDELADSWALCKGPREMAREIPRELFDGVRVGDYQFTALTRDREEVRRRYGSGIVLERANIEDVMVHTFGGTKE